jgi:LmbE family N-acetylglucosaminyl deacetylase
MTGRWLTRFVAAAAITMAFPAWSSMAGVVAADPEPATGMLGSHPWLPPPAKADLMVINTHPDDEGIFFGGALPYYTTVRQVETVLVSMTSGDWGRAPEVREEELRNAAWIYGLRYQPIFPRFRDYPTTTLDATWDVWADGVLDGDDVAAGKAKAARRLAAEIRRFQPEVILTHDLAGEYGHNNHKATASSVADAFALAADPSVDLDGLAPWQAKKLYVHLYANDSDRDNDLTDEPLRITGPVVNTLFHSWDTPFSQLDGKTPLEVANAGLAAHVSQGGSNLVTTWAQRRLSEYWALVATTVGPDRIARNDFFENIALVPEPGSLGLLALGGLCWRLWIPRARRSCRKKQRGLGQP